MTQKQSILETVVSLLKPHSQGNKIFRSIALESYTRFYFNLERGFPSNFYLRVGVDSLSYYYLTKVKDEDYRARFEKWLLRYLHANNLQIIGNVKLID